MTREELLTAARNAKAEGLTWYSETGLTDDANLPVADALFISLCGPDVALDLLSEIDELRQALDAFGTWAVNAHDFGHLDPDTRDELKTLIGQAAAALGSPSNRPPRDRTGGMMIDKGTGGDGRP